MSLSIHNLQKVIYEFRTYITTNQSFLVNYGDRYRNGETISSAFVESTVNEIISKRFAKKQQMRWTKKGAQQLLQVRSQILNNMLRETFCRWYLSSLRSYSSYSLPAIPSREYCQTLQKFEITSMIKKGMLPSIALVNKILAYVFKSIGKGANDEFRTTERARES